MGLSKASTSDRTAVHAMRAAETSRRPARSRSKPPQCASQPKLPSTTQRRSSTTTLFCSGSRSTAWWRMPYPFDHSRQRSATKAPSRMASRRLGHCALPSSRVGSVSRAWAEAGTTAMASQVPSASTSAQAELVACGRTLATEHLLAGVIAAPAPRQDALGTTACR